jgi:hypothetical protein
LYIYIHCRFLSNKLHTPSDCDVHVISFPAQPEQQVRNELQQQLRELLRRHLLQLSLLLHRQELTPLSIRIRRRKAMMAMTQINKYYANIAKQVLQGL